MKKAKLFSRFLFFLMFIFVHQHVVPADLLKNVSISGTVTDENTNEPMPGVNIVIEGENTGTVTDINGSYSISVSSESSVPPGLGRLPSIVVFETVVDVGPRKAPERCHVRTCHEIWHSEGSWVRCGQFS